MARVGVAERPWSLVLKVLGPAAGPDDPTHIGYWKREMLLYSSRLLGVCPRIRSWRRKPPRNNLLTVIWTLSWSN